MPKINKSVVEINMTMPVRLTFIEAALQVEWPDRNITVTELPPVDGKVDVLDMWKKRKVVAMCPDLTCSLLIDFIKGELQPLIDTLQRRCEDERKSGYDEGFQDGVSRGYDDGQRQAELVEFEKERP